MAKGVTWAFNARGARRRALEGEHVQELARRGRTGWETLSAAVTVMQSMGGRERPPPRRAVPAGRAGGEGTCTGDQTFSAQAVANLMSCRLHEGRACRWYMYRLIAACNEKH
eukprot:4726297-Prymnesium_polylepis.1